MIEGTPDAVAAVVLAVQAVTAAVSFVVEISDSRGGR